MDSPEKSKKSAWKNCWEEKYKAAEMENKHQPLREEHMETIRRSGLLSGLAKGKDTEAVSQLGFQVKQLGAEEMAILEGDRVTDIMILHAGGIRGEKFHLEGNVDLMHMYQRGEIFGAEAVVSRFKTSPLTYIADKEAVILRVPFRSITQSEFSGDIMLALLRILADDNIKKLYKIETLSKRGLRERVMTDLRIISRKVGSPCFSIHMDRAQFAQYLCVNRTALSYELNQMKRDGLIDFQKDRFHILEKNQ
jgi:CRP-like cAMP-binding protein